MYPKGACPSCFPNCASVGLTSIPSCNMPLFGAEWYQASSPHFLWNSRVLLPSVHCSGSSKATKSLQYPTQRLQDWETWQSCLIASISLCLLILTNAHIAQESCLESDHIDRCRGIRWTSEFDRAVCSLEAKLPGLFARYPLIPGLWPPTKSRRLSVVYSQVSTIWPWCTRKSLRQRAQYSLLFILPVCEIGCWIRTRYPLLGAGPFQDLQPWSPCIYCLTSFIFIIQLISYISDLHANAITTIPTGAFTGLGKLNAL